MADAELRDRYRAYQAGSVGLEEMAQAIRRRGLWPTYNYVSCTCNPETRCTRRGQLCGKCGGQGWTEQHITGWIHADGI